MRRGDLPVTSTLFLDIKSLVSLENNQWRVSQYTGVKDLRDFADFRDLYIYIYIDTYIYTVKSLQIDLPRDRL